MKQNNQIRNSRSRKIGVGVGFALATIAVGSAIAVPNIIAYQNRPQSTNNTEWVDGPGEIGSGFYTDTVEILSLETPIKGTAVATSDHTIQYISLYNLGNDLNFPSPSGVHTIPVITIDGEIKAEGADYELTEDVDGNPTVRLFNPLTPGQKIEVELTIDTTQVIQEVAIGDYCVARMWNDDVPQSLDVEWMQDGFDGYSDKAGWYTNDTFTIDRNEQKTVSFLYDGNESHVFDHFALFSSDGIENIKIASVTIGGGILLPSALEQQDDKSYKLKTDPITGTDPIWITLTMGSHSGIEGKDLVLGFWKDNTPPVGTNVLTYYSKGHETTNLIGYQNATANTYGVKASDSWSCEVDKDHPVKYLAAIDDTGQKVIIEPIIKDAGGNDITTSWSQEIGDDGNPTGVWKYNGEKGLTNTNLTFDITFTNGSTRKTIIRAWSDNDINTLAWRKFNDDVGYSYFSELTNITDNGFVFTCYVNQWGQDVDHIKLVDSEGKQSEEYTKTYIDAIWLDGEDDTNSWAQKDGEWVRTTGGAIAGGEGHWITISGYHDSSAKNVAFQMYASGVTPVIETTMMDYDDGTKTRAEGYYSQGESFAPGATPIFTTQANGDLDIQDFSLVDDEGNEYETKDYKVKFMVQTGTDTWQEETSDSADSTWQADGEKWHRVSPLPYGTNIRFQITSSENLDDNFSAYACGYDKTYGTSYMTPEDQQKGWYSNSTKILTTGVNFAVHLDDDNDKVINRFAIINDSYEKQPMSKAGWTVKVFKDNNVVVDDTTNWEIIDGDHLERTKGEPYEAWDRVVFCLNANESAFNAKVCAWKKDTQPLISPMSYKDTEYLVDPGYYTDTPIEIGPDGVTCTCDVSEEHPLFRIALVDNNKQLVDVDNYTLYSIQVYNENSGEWENDGDNWKVTEAEGKYKHCSYYRSIGALMQQKVKFVFKTESAINLTPFGFKDA